MKKILLILLMLPMFVFGQTYYRIYADTTIFGSIGSGKNEVVIKNRTKDSTGGFLSNKGNGVTEFKKLRSKKINDSTYVIVSGTTVLGDTIKVKSTGGGGSGGTNIYNSDGLVTDSVRNVYTTSMLNFIDTANKTFSSIGGAVFPNPLTGALTYIPSLPGIYNSKFFWTPNASQFILASNKVDEDVSRFNVGSEIFDLNNNIIVGGKGSYEKSDSNYYYRLFYKHPDNESLWLTLGAKQREGFFITPFEYSHDTPLADTWKHPYTFRVADTLDNVFFGTKTEGKIFIDAPVNNFVTSLVGWNNADSTLALVDVSSIGGVSQLTLNDSATALNTRINDKTSKLITTNRQTSSYTLVLSDADKIVEMDNASANNLTIPLNATVAYPIGTQLTVTQYGAGQTTFVPTVGVTIRSDSSKLKIASQYSGATLIKIATNEWYLIGNLSN